MEGQRSATTSPTTACRPRTSRRDRSSERSATTFLGNPTQKTYDFNLSGGGALVQNRLWVNGTIRKWVVNKLVNATNPDGTQALDDNDLKNYSGKVVASAARRTTS